MRNLLFLLFAIILVSCDKNVDNIKTPLIVNSKLTGDLQSGAIELFKQSVLTEDADKNVIISPLSIQYAIGMSANGASGVTLDELMKVLGAPSEQLK
ncbi:MAG: serpin family protein, partial [Saprospiraceae bacterium]